MFLELEEGQTVGARDKGWIAGPLQAVKYVLRTDTYRETNRGKSAALFGGLELAMAASLVGRSSVFVAILRSGDNCQLPDLTSQ